MTTYKQIDLIFKISILFVINCQVFFAECIAQNTRISDSLRIVLKQDTLSKEEKTILLRNLAYYHPKLDSASYYAKESLRIASEIKKPILEAKAWEEIGAIEQRLGNSTQSLDAILKALRIYETLALTNEQAASYLQIATHHIGEKEYEKAIQSFKKAEDIYSASKDSLYLAYTLINKGEAYRLSHNFDHATNAFTKALQLNIILKDPSIKGYSVGNLGMIYNAQNKLESARKQLQQAITVLEELQDYYSTSIYLFELGEVYQKENNWNLAEEKKLAAMTMAKQAGLKEQIRDFSASLAENYKTRQEYEKALQYQEQYQVYQDSLINKENIQKTEQIRASFEIDKRQAKIGLLQTINTQQKYLLALLIIGIVLLIFFLYLLYQNHKKEKKANHTLSQQKNIISKREQEKALLLKELNHRVKNNLQMISSLLNLQSKELTGHPAKEAITSGKYRVEALSLVHKKLYQEGVDTKIALKEYIEELVSGLFFGHGTAFKPQLTIDNINVHIDLAIPLALIINELVINALKYAFTDIRNPSFQVIISKKTKNQLNIQVIDNGVGFSIKKKSNSFGIKLISSLIEQLEGTIEKIESNGTYWNMNLKLS